MEPIQKPTSSAGAAGAAQGKKSKLLRGASQILRDKTPKGLVSGVAKKKKLRKGTPRPSAGTSQNPDQGHVSLTETEAGTGIGAVVAPDLGLASERPIDAGTGAGAEEAEDSELEAGADKVIRGR